MEGTCEAEFPGLAPRAAGASDTTHGPVHSRTMPGYRIRCPRCAGKADGVMVLSGTRGTYREVYLDYRLERIICPACGLATNVEPGTGYELYYRTDFRGHTLWARNEDHIDALVAWLTSNTSATGTPFEALPQWMLRNRAKVVECLRSLRQKLE